MDIEQLKKIYGGTVMIDKKTKDEFATNIHHAIDAWIEADCGNLTFTSDEYELGYEVKLSI